MTGQTKPSIYHICKNSKPNNEQPIYNIFKENKQNSIVNKINVFPNCSFHLLAQIFLLGPTEH